MKIKLSRNEIARWEGYREIVKYKYLCFKNNIAKQGKFGGISAIQFGFVSIVCIS